MNRFARIITVAFVASLAVSIAAPAFGTASTPDEGATEPAVVEAPVFPGEPPAVVLPPVEEEAFEQPWTVRFTYPLFAALAVLIIGGYAVGYRRSVRNRYQVVG